MVTIEVDTFEESLFVSGLTDVGPLHPNTVFKFGVVHTTCVQTFWPSHTRRCGSLSLSEACLFFLDKFENCDVIIGS